MALTLFARSRAIHLSLQSCIVESRYDDTGANLPQSPVSAAALLQGANNIAYLFFAVLASTSELDVQRLSPSVRPAAPDVFKCQLGSADNSPPMLEGPVLVPNPVHSFGSGSVVADRETFRASGITGSCYLPLKLGFGRRQSRKASRPGQRLL